MFNKQIRLLGMVMLILFIAGCRNIQPAEKSGTANPSLDLSIDQGTWECIDNNWNVVSTDPVETLPIPDIFEGENANEIGEYIEKGDPTGLVWAMGGLLSPDEEYATYNSNKDSVKENIAGGMSLFLLNTKTGEERILLKSETGEYYSALWWIDNELVFCQRYGGENASSYMICNISGKSIPITLLGSVPVIRSHQGNYFAYVDDSGNNTEIRVAYINPDGIVMEYIQYIQRQGFLMADCAISSDQTKMALKVREDYDSPNRSIVIWDFETNSSHIIDDPIIQNVTNVSVINFDWSDRYLIVNYLVRTASDQHNELWQYNIH